MQSAEYHYVRVPAASPSISITYRIRCGVVNDMYNERATRIVDQSTS